MNKTPQHPVEQAFVQAVKACAQTPRRWLIGYSGGLDSQVLAHLAVSFLAPAQVQLIHINHGLQAAAAEFETHCREWAYAHSCVLDVIKVAPESASEDAARTARYAAFSRRVNEADLLLLGQHADDQAETLLFRMVRGTGLKGLAGMPSARSIGRGQLLRPLLSVSRAQLEEYARLQQLTWVEDPSNADSRYARNFLRHKVMAPLQRNWPYASRKMAALAAHINQQRALLEEFGREDLKRAAEPMGAISVAFLNSLSTARQANLLQVWLAQWQLVLNDRLLSQINELLAAAADRQPQVKLSDGSSLRRFGMKLFRVPAFSVDPLPAQMPLQEFCCAQGELSIEQVSGAGLKTLTDLTLRVRRPGDRIWRAERAVHQSIKNFFQEQAVPPWLRDHWPLVCAGDEVVAIAGLYVVKDWQAAGHEQQGYQIIWRSFGLSEGSYFAIL